MCAVILKGITWGHSRGITPLLALSQRYTELHPEVEISWKKRTLQEFADYPIEKLTAEYDLLIIDHPWVGCASVTGCVLPLDEYLPPAYLADQLAHSVGRSHQSYEYNGKQWALAIDAAAPVASYRKDLLETNGVVLPRTWAELLALAKKGRVALPAVPIDTLMNFYTFCLAEQGTLFAQPTEITDRGTGLRAIRTMKELYRLLHREMFTYNPIAVAERMSTGNDYWYCPFAYGYSNYSRIGYARYPVHYDQVVTYNDKPLQTTLGGTGLAVSVSCKHKEIAVDFAAWAASGQCQQTMYVQHGGQPGHGAAWKNKAANQLTDDFFSNTLPVMNNSYLRPRYNGYLHFQDQAARPLQQCLLNDTDPEMALDEMNAIYRRSRHPEKKGIII